MTDKSSIELRVAEALKRDAGRGIVRIDPADMQAIGVGIGDFVRLRGKRSTLCKAMPAFADERGQSRAQLDGIARTNAGLGIDDPVTITSATPPPAETVTLAPKDMQVQERDLPYIGSLLDGIPVSNGDTVRATLFGSRTADFTVQSCTPGPEAVIVPTTQLLVPKQSQTPKNNAPKQAGTPTYEDIGGLGSQHARIREMIELAL